MRLFELFPYGSLCPWVYCNSNCMYGLDLPVYHIMAKRSNDHKQMETLIIYGIFCDLSLFANRFLFLVNLAAPLICI